ncbi:MAG TPA: BsuPI-related putative proteinase inhibitor [Steroidobacteraceae bacterium]
MTVLGLLAICLGATSGKSCSISDFLKGDSSNSDDPPFVTELTLVNSAGENTDTFDFGETIEMQLTVRNRLTTTAEAQFSTTRTSDFVVVNDNSSTVLWKWSTNQPTAGTTPTTLTFEPGETKTFTVDWNQLGDSGIATNPGTYEARGVLVYDGFDTNPLQTNNMGSSPKQFTIRSP